MNYIITYLFILCIYIFLYIFVYNFNLKFKKSSINVFTKEPPPDVFSFSPDKNYHILINGSSFRFWLLDGVVKPVAKR